jgi:hypothetical protein
MSITAATVWDDITEHAKSRFDYAAFESVFRQFDIKMAENILFLVIQGLALGDSKKVIASELHREALSLGLKLDERFIAEFLECKDQELAQEIEEVRFARSMLEQGMRLSAVREAVARISG